MLAHFNHSPGFKYLAQSVFVSTLTSLEIVTAPLLSEPALKAVLGAHKRLAKVTLVNCPKVRVENVRGYFKGEVSCDHCCF